MTPERIAEIREDLELQAEGIEPGYWTDTVNELLDDLAAARIAELSDEIMALQADGTGYAHGYQRAGDLAAARIEDLATRNVALVAALTHCLTAVHVPTTPCRKCWNYFPLINCEPCRAGNHVKCRLDACPCICPPDQQPEDVCKGNRALLAQHGEPSPDPQ